MAEEGKEVKKLKKLAIVGCAESKVLAPFQDESYEIWGMNNLYGYIPRWTRWFEIHPLAFNGKEYTRRGNPNFRGLSVTKYLQSIGAMKTPVYLQKLFPEIMPNGILYPLKEILEMFPRRYFTNSVSYMIALGIMEKFDVIDIYGVDMAVDCLAPGTRVLTSDLQWVPCEQVEIGDDLIGFDENPGDGNGSTRRWRKTKVVQTGTVINHCYRIHFEDGSSIVASENHGWLTHGENVNRWKTTKDLFTSYHREGKPTRVLKVLNTWNEAKDYDAGYLAAAYEGEGSINQTERSNGYEGNYQFQVSFAQRENVMLEKVTGMLTAQGFDYSVRDNDGCKIVNIKGGRAENMRFLGTVRPQRLLEKFCPEKLGEIQSIENLAVVGMDDLGTQETIGIQTTTKTIIAEGLASHNTEYFWQRPSCEYFIGLAEGMGIKVYMPETAHMLKAQFLYGFEEDKESFASKTVQGMIAGMEQRKATELKKAEISNNAVQQYIGAISCAKEIHKMFKTV